MEKYSLKLIKRMDNPFLEILGRSVCPLMGLALVKPCALVVIPAPSLGSSSPSWALFFSHVLFNCLCSVESPKRTPIRLADCHQYVTLMIERPFGIAPINFEGSNYMVLMTDIFKYRACSRVFGQPGRLVANLQG